MQPVAVTLTLVALSGACLIALAAIRSLVVAQPDEWLLCIRNGRLVKAGVGVYLWRRPGDVVARFTSTVQRVGFNVEALSAERLRVSIGGFIFWSVSTDREGPFRAFQKLGLANLDSRRHQLQNPKHLLATPQHRAFQQLLGAAVQRLAANKSLDDLLLKQDLLVGELGAQLAALEPEMGIHIERIEFLQVRPVDKSLLRQMSAEVEERLREEAANIHLQTSERAQRNTIESDARIAHEKAAITKDAMVREKALRLDQLEHDREVREHEQAVEREQALENERRALEMAKAAVLREEVNFAARLDRIRRKAEAERDAMSIVASAEEQKSPSVRDHELSKLITEKVGDALVGLPINEARWVTVGQDSPATSIAGIISTAHELVSGAAPGREQL